MTARIRSSFLTLALVSWGVAPAIATTADALTPAYTSPPPELPTPVPERLDDEPATQAAATQAAATRVAGAGSESGEDARAGSGPASAPHPDSAQDGLRLSLEEALAIAFDQSPQLALQQAYVRIAETQAETARSPLRPTVTAQAGIELSTGSGYVAGSQQLSGNQNRSTATSINASIQAEQLIFDFGAVGARRAAARARIQSAASSYAQAEETTAYAVIRAYLEAGAAMAQWRVADEALRAETQRSALIDGYVDAGLRPSIDRATARANLASARARVIDAAMAYELASFDLLLAMGVREDRALHIELIALETDSLDAITVQDLDALARAQRGEFRSLEADLDAAAFTLRATRQGGLPSLRGVAGVSESLLIGRNGRWNAYIGARVVWTIYNGGQVRSQLREREAELARLRAEETLLLTTIVDEVRRAQRQMRGARASLETRALLVGSAEEQLRLAQGRYETGLGNIVELSDAQQALTEALFAQIASRLQVAQAQASLMAAVAGWAPTVRTQRQE